MVTTKDYTYTLDTIAEAAKQVLAYWPKHTVWLLQGEMGAGKTTLAQHLCAAMKCEDEISSPTFSLVNNYESKQYGLIHHFDFYRITNLREAIDMGIFEYLDSGNLCLIEWAENVQELLPDNCLKLDITIIDEKTRSLNIVVN